jgi:anionic cell wall polymer biosynthesis LytR-Cps2A-Psr (LCP) family protein
MSSGRIDLDAHFPYILGKGGTLEVSPEGECMRRVGQALVLLLMAICAVGAGAFIVIALYYHRFSTEVRMAEASVPATVVAVLSPTAGTRDQSQVTLVRGSGQPASGGVVLFRTVPAGGATAFLSIPRSAVLAGEPVSRLDTPGLVRGLSTTMGIGISHVAIINPSSVSRLIDTVGGIEFENPAAFRTQISPSQYWSFPRGQLNLNGARTAAFLRQGSPESERRDQAEQRVLRAIVGRALAPTSVTQLPATGRAIAETATDLTDADVLGLVWMRLDDRQVVQCAFAEHQTIDSAQGQAIAAAFLGREGGERLSACRTQAIAPASFVPPKAVLVTLQKYGTWVFVMIAAAAMLIALGTAALFARIRLGATTTAPVLPLGGAAPGPTPTVTLFRSAPATPRLGRANQPAPAAALADGVRSQRSRNYPRDLARVSQALAGTGSSIQRAFAGAAATLHVSMGALGRVVRTIAAFSRVGLERVTAIRQRVSQWHVHGRRRAVALIGGGPPARPGYRSRVRRFVYMHQDAMWIGLCAAVPTGILIRLLSS